MSKNNKKIDFQDVLTILKEENEGKETFDVKLTEGQLRFLADNIDEPTTSSIKSSLESVYDQAIFSITPDVFDTEFQYDLYRTKRVIDSFDYLK